MLCAECPRCRRRSIIGVNRNQTLTEGDEPAELRLRCDLCGSRQVRIVRVQSPIEALRFTTGRS
ncbi:MAG: hypothetical protein B7X99_00155 [Rhizobiales bacterium 17-65-6]|nr:MAG: hypothetical protein B7Z30_01375 [Rhizobiales bacterium 12-68-15]OYX87302.1 MAG: hypothetical protein B7Y84_12100 [Azorhizobium sp. 32-67-21]OYY09082.1 MAG: hypothetical protein B7Y70_10850 [Rhizobiales bacterium 35-68-8]OZA01562.1 MAG: hypothetical protein B7X99_00155 [Rhizobiales bacterium 17-65-6]